MEFSKKEGLCVALSEMYPNEPAAKGMYSAIKIEIFNQFRSAGLSQGFPFGINDYLDGQIKGTQHLCPKRRAWVKDHINNPPANQSQKLTDFYVAWWKWANETK